MLLAAKLREKTRCLQLHLRIIFSTLFFLFIDFFKTHDQGDLLYYIFIEL